eukprot:Phypoly_transcript_02686.p1 GENE.Phypoly_transcript_02686~~Phypoly_transcript_02686.p1  ORF type:complete len:366 (+),score=31.18 Phypoly_transcript_02686:1609-2706(+)
MRSSSVNNSLGAVIYVYSTAPAQTNEQITEIENCIFQDNTILGVSTVLLEVPGRINIRNTTFLNNVQGSNQMQSDTGTSGALNILYPSNLPTPKAPNSFLVLLDGVVFNNNFDMNSMGSFAGALSITRGNGSIIGSTFLGNNGVNMRLLYPSNFSVVSTSFSAPTPNTPVQSPSLLWIGADFNYNVMPVPYVVNMQNVTCLLNSSYTSFACLSVVNTMGNVTNVTVSLNSSSLVSNGRNGSVLVEGSYNLDNSVDLIISSSVIQPDITCAQSATIELQPGSNITNANCSAISGASNFCSFQGDGLCGLCAELKQCAHNRHTPFYERVWGIAVLCGAGVTVLAILILLVVKLRNKSTRRDYQSVIN